MDIDTDILCCQSTALYWDGFFYCLDDFDAVFGEQLDGEGVLVGQEPGLHLADAVLDDVQPLVDRDVGLVQGVHGAVHEVLGVAVGGLLVLDQRAQVVDPEELGLAVVEAGQDAVHVIGPLPESLGEFRPDEVGRLRGGEPGAVLELEELQVPLDVVAELQDVGVLASEGQELAVIQVPDLVLVVLG